MMKFTLFIICLLSFSSCFVQKQKIGPYIKLRIFDSKTKEPINNVRLFHAGENDSLGSIKLGIVSNKRGIMVIPKSEMSIPRGAGGIIPFKHVSGKYILFKKGYQNFVLDTHKSFDINEDSNMSKRHKSEVFLIKND